MPRVAFEATIPAFERVKILHVLHPAATVISCVINWSKNKQRRRPHCKKLVRMTSLYVYIASYERHQPTPSNPFNPLTRETSMTGESSGTNFGARVFKFCINIIKVVAHIPLSLTISKS
jgi:hypothetical protein